jgi:hypothetical protein
MGKILSAIIILSVIPNICILSQTKTGSTVPDNQTQKDTVIQQKLNPQEFNSVINQEFSKLITGQSSNTIGSFASLNITDPTVTFSPNYIFKNGDIITAKISGGISDGIYGIFTNSKLNNNVAMDIQYHVINRIVTQYITYNTDDLINIRKNLQDLKDNLSTDTLKIKSNQDINILILGKYQLDKKIKELKEKGKNIDRELKKKNIKEDMEETNKKLKSIDNSLSAILCNDTSKNEINCCKITLCRELNDNKDNLEKKKTNLKKELESLDNEDTILMLKAQKDSISYEIRLAEMNRDITSNKINTMEKDKARLTRNVRQRFNKFIADSEQTGFKNLKVWGTSLGWFSFGYKVMCNKFKLFSPFLSPSDQISNKSFISHELRGQYSYYCFSPYAFSTYYMTFGINYNYRDNFTDLSKTEITEVTNYGQNVLNRTTTNKYTAYVGDYKEGFSEINFDAELYYFLFTDNQAAIHIFPDSRFSDQQKPIWDIGLGIVYTFTNQDKKGSVVNAELYYRMKDISNVTENNNTIFERNEIGLRFTFPINFNIN